MVDLNFDNLNAWLLNSKVSHLNIKTMEMNPLNTLINSVCKTPLTDLLNTNAIRKCTELVELAEQVVEVDHGSWIICKSVPEAAYLGWSGGIFVVTNDFGVIPREWKNVSMLLFRESHIDTKTLVNTLKIVLLVRALFLLHLDLIVGREVHLGCESCHWVVQFA